MYLVILFYLLYFNFILECINVFCCYFLNLDIDECVSLLCIYGNCIDNVNGYWCLCDLGYVGFYCELSIW